MKFLVFFLTLSFAISLKDSNKQLRETNRILKKSLRSMKNDKKSVNEDYLYNKEKLQAFIQQYSLNTDTEVKFALLEGIEYYCESILDNFEVLGVLEGVPLKEIQDVILSLNQQIQKHHTFTLSKDLSDKYNSLKMQISVKEDTLHKIQQENSYLLGKFATSAAEVDDYHLKLSMLQEKIHKIEKELQSLKEAHNSHIENLKSVIQTTSIDSIAREKSNFESIQESQDVVISSLQAKSEELALKLEQISVENSGIQAKINIFLNNISRLERDLSAKNAELLSSENKFEEFRSTVEADAQKEVENLRESEK